MISIRTEPLRRIDSILSQIEYYCRYNAKDESRADDVHYARTLLTEHIESEELINTSMTQHVQWLYEQMKEKRQLEDAQRPYTPVLDNETGSMWMCGNCGTYVGREDFEYDKFCRECGHPVKWENRWEEHQRRMASDDEAKESANE